MEMFQIKQRNRVIRKDSLSDRLREAKALLDRADAVVIGAGAGLSDAAGIHYSGPRFTENFSDFIQRYGMTDMYTAGFYPFSTEEEKWAYWSRHIRMNRYDAPAGEVYRQLLSLAEGTPYFVLTTNVDGQFPKAGFDPDRIWAVQGDYGKLQCARGCHDKLYDAKDLIFSMTEEQRDCKVPSDLVPRCPVCHGRMEVNIRKDRYFVQDGAWYENRNHFESFLKEWKESRLLFLELGVGYNTPTIIRIPFERLTAALHQASLVRVNLSYPDVPREIAAKSISLSADIQQAVEGLAKAP